MSAGLDAAIRAACNTFGGIACQWPECRETCSTVPEAVRAALAATWTEEDVERVAKAMHAVALAAEEDDWKPSGWDGESAECQNGFRDMARAALAAMPAARAFLAKHDGERE